MKHVRHLIPVLATLAACGKAPEESAAGPTTTVAAPAAMKAGEWSVEVSAAGMPPRTGKLCLTAADIARGAIVGAEDARGCTFTRRQLAGGRITMAATCAHGGGGHATLSVDGSYGADRFETRTAMAVGFTPQSTGKMTFVTRGRHVADRCTPAEEADTGA